MIQLLFILFSMLFWGNSMIGNDVVREARWEHRLLAYVVTNEEERVAFESHLERWSAELEERDILWVNLGDIRLGTDRSLEMGAGEKDLWREVWKLDGSESRVVLIGKDGGPKAFQRGGLDLPLFFELIDRMPMRMAEMREQSSQASE